MTHLFWASAGFQKVSTQKPASQVSRKSFYIFKQSVTYWGISGALRIKVVCHPPGISGGLHLPQKNLDAIFAHTACVYRKKIFKTYRNTHKMISLSFIGLFDDSTTYTQIF